MRADPTVKSLLVKIYIQEKNRIWKNNMFYHWQKKKKTIIITIQTQRCVEECATVYHTSSIVIFLFISLFPRLSLSLSLSLSLYRVISSVSIYICIPVLTRNLSEEDRREKYETELEEWRHERRERRRWKLEAMASPS